MIFNSKKKGNGSPAGVKDASKAARGKAPAGRPQQGQGPVRPAAAPARGPDNGALSSTLNSHLSFEGDLNYSGTILVDCDFRGSIVTEDTLLVGESGNVEADISAGVVEISGKVSGNINAMSRVKILSGGEVHGNIVTPTISMEEGVLFEGNCTRRKPDPAPQQQRSAQQQARPQQSSSASLSSAANPANHDKQKESVPA